MAVDVTYNGVGFYKKQGTQEPVLASGSTFDVYGSIDVLSGGGITIEDGASIAVPVVTETTAAALDSFGVSICGSTKVKKNYTLGAPVAGELKAIEFTVSAATGYVHAGSTGYTIEDSLGSGKWIKAVGNGSALLMGITATKYMLISMTTSISHTTSST